MGPESLIYGWQNLPLVDYKPAKVCIVPQLR